MTAVSEKPSRRAPEPRPAHSYRAARRNACRECGPQWPVLWRKLQLDAYQPPKPRKQRRAVAQPMRAAA